MKVRQGADTPYLFAGNTSMATNVNREQEGSHTDERSTDLEVTVCRDGRHLNVRNQQSGSGEVHTVTVDDGHAAECTCKGFKFHDNCYHVDTVEASPLLTSSAQSLAASHSPVMADGGHTEGETCDRCQTLLGAVHEAHEATVVTTEDEELCPDCADARCGKEIGFGQCDRDNCPYCEDSDETDVLSIDESERGVVDPYADDEEVNTTPL